MIRSVFRVIEYVQGNAGYLLSHEVFLYIFDALLMLAVMLLFNWNHPSEVTEAYQKRRMKNDARELQNVRDKYMGRDLERAGGSEAKIGDGRSGSEGGRVWV